jgi:pimeloyl-ACP methyl ester carboxylesterase
MFSDVSFNLPTGSTLAAKVWSLDKNLRKSFEVDFPPKFKYSNSERLYESIETNNVKPEAFPETADSKIEYIPIIAIHGWLDNCGSWDILVPLMLQAIDKPVVIVAVDLPGHGLSAHRPWSSGYPFPIYVRDMIELVTTCLQWPKYFLMGHSLGITSLVLLHVIVRWCNISFDCWHFP